MPLAKEGAHDLIVSVECITKSRNQLYQHHHQGEKLAFQEKTVAAQFHYLISLNLPLMDRFVNSI